MIIKNPLLKIRDIFSYFIFKILLKKINKNKVYIIKKIIYTFKKHSNNYNKFNCLTTFKKITINSIVSLSLFLDAIELIVKSFTIQFLK